MCAHPEEDKCMNTTSGIITLCQWLSGMQVKMELIMFQATMCSSSGEQLYEYNFWYNHSVSVAVRYAGQDRTHQATMCSSSGGQLYEYNFWYNHCVLVAIR